MKKAMIFGLAAILAIATACTKKQNYLQRHR